MSFLVIPFIHSISFQFKMFQMTRLFEIVISAVRRHYPPISLYTIFQYSLSLYICIYTLLIESHRIPIYQQRLLKKRRNITMKILTFHKRATYILRLMYLPTYEQRSSRILNILQKQVGLSYNCGRKNICITYKDIYIL